MAAAPEIITISDDEETDESSNEFAETVAAMVGMFPSVPTSRVRRIVLNFHRSGSDVVVDELLKEVEKRSDTSSRDSPHPDPPPSKRARHDDGRETSDEEDMVKVRVQMLRTVLQDADPDFLEEKALEVGDDEQKLQDWLNEAVETRHYPKLVEYLKRKEYHDILEQYSQMSPEDFLDIFASADYPGDIYSRRERSAPSESYKTNAITFLRMMFADTDESLIDEAMEEAKGLLVPAVHYLEAVGCVRGVIPSCEAFETGGALDLVFIQEITFLRLESEIQSIVFARGLQHDEAKAEARESGALFECPICGDDDILLDDVLECNAGVHLFCAKCVKRQAEIAASEAHPSVGCLEQCTGVFTLAQLRGLVDPLLLNTLVKAVQQHELKEAALDDVLVACPFCAFSCEIEDQDVDVFKCLNPVCRIDSCRKCKKVAHGSVPCEKVETDDQSKARLLLEEKLTAALIRHCPRCKKQVLKMEGCNHMTCPCGTHFCYICRKDITGHVSRHFRGGRSCQLHEDTTSIHRRNLAEAVEQGKQEVQMKFGNVSLVHDPTAGPLTGPSAAELPQQPAFRFHPMDMPPPGAFLFRAMVPQNAGFFLPNALRFSGRPVRFGHLPRFVHDTDQPGSSHGLPRR